MQNWAWARRRCYVLQVVPFLKRLGRLLKLHTRRVGGGKCLDSSGTTINDHSAFFHRSLLTATAVAVQFQISKEKDCRWLTFQAMILFCSVNGGCCYSAHLPLSITSMFLRLCQVFCYFTFFSLSELLLHSARGCDPCVFLPPVEHLSFIPHGWQSEKEEAAWGTVRRAVKEKNLTQLPFIYNI